MESNIQGSLLLPLVRVGFISSPFRSPIARSSIGGLFFSFWSFRKHSAWGEWLSTGWEFESWILPWKDMCRGKSEQSDGGHGKESSGQGEPRGCKYCSTATHAARNGAHGIKGQFFSLFGTPQHFREGLGWREIWDSTFFWRVTPEYCKLGRFCSVKMDQRETRFSLSIRVLLALVHK